MEKNKNTPQNGNGRNGTRRKSIMALTIVSFLVAGAVAFVYLWQSKQRVYVEKSRIEAPEISLSSASGGILEKLYVKPGDSVTKNEVVAQIGNDMVMTRDAGLVISTQNSIGKNFSPGETVATIIRPEDLRVTAQVEEDKGLSNVKVGQRVMFTVDAFSGKKYYGLVDEISPTARTSDVVFNISSQREEQDFDVKIRFDISQYPELKNGMSAKSWIYKD